MNRVQRDILEYLDKYPNSTLEKLERNVFYLWSIRRNLDYLVRVGLVHLPVNDMYRITTHGMRELERK